jgi:hypothetical protein
VPGGGGGGQTAPGSEEDPNLVHLAIYGIAALYERFDPAKATPAPKP